MPNIAAIHLITANCKIGSPVIAASVLIFGKDKVRESWVVRDYTNILIDHGDDMFAQSNGDHCDFLINSGAQIVEQDVIISRLIGCQARHQTEATIWGNHFESHVSHYAYAFAQVGQKRDIMLKGANFDGLTLNAANRFVAENDKNFPTCASSPEAALYYLKELYIGARKLLGHDIESDNQKLMKAAAPKLAAAAAAALPQLPPALPPLPGKPMNNLTLPPLPPTLPKLPGQ